jgi:hypothetical protein
VQINWITVAADGVDPNPEDQNLVFAEGDLVDLWVQYEAADVEFSRTWKLDTAGLDFSEGYVYHGQAGVFQVKLDFQLPYGSASNAATFTVELGPPRTTSAMAGPDHEDSASVGLTITETAVQEPLTYPPVPPGSDPNAPDCMPEWIDVVFSEDLVTVDVESEKELSNVVLQFGDYTLEKWDDLDENLEIIYSGTFYGTGENTGKLLRGIWVKSGCNAGGDGAGYGEFFPAFPESRQGMMVWEDMLAYSDYDYNDMVASMHCREFRNLSDEVVQLDLHIKALARASSYASIWQFNVEAAFPGAYLITIVDQYYYTGERHGPQRIWTSVEGVSIPVFSPTCDALPPPPDHPYATNGVAGTTYVEGDYAIVRIILSPPRSASICTEAPYKPELRVKASGGKVYVIGVWHEPGDPVDSNGRPLAFIVPDTFAWPLEGKKIWDCYPPFEAWVEWINDQSLPEPYPVWSQTEPVVDFFDRDLFN